MTDLAAFLTACIDTDEQVARAATPGPWDDFGDQGVGGASYAEVANWRGIDPNEYRPTGRPMSPADSTHIARWHPARVLAECAAKRAIVAEYQASVRAVGESLSVPLRRVVLALAQPYADRPGFDPAWRVS